MSDFFFNSLTYGKDVAMQIEKKFDAICENCKEKCDPYVKMHRSTECDKIFRMDELDGIDWSKATENNTPSSLVHLSDGSKLLISSKKEKGD